MALTRTAGPTQFSSSASAQSSYSLTNALTCTSGNSAFVALCVCIDPGTTNLTTITLGGVAMTIVKNERVVTSGSTGTHAVVAKLVGHSLSGAQTLVVNASGGDMYGISGAAFEYSGTSAPDVDVSNSVNSTGTTQSLTLTGVAASAAIIAAHCVQFCSNEATANGAAYTMVDLANMNILHQAEYTDNAGSAGNKTVDFVNCDLLYAIAAMSITDGGGGGGGTGIDPQLKSITQLLAVKRAANF